MNPVRLLLLVAALAMLLFASVEAAPGMPAALERRGRKGGNNSLKSARSFSGTKSAKTHSGTKSAKSKRPKSTATA
ncbi:hypothetical protein DFJ74DRAFT_364224 [Hyaloraphidium curvatum]|nr:hypothetical protein DFJ74DRAFT_364224 [Hyaloraphidium curvatum]